MKKIAALLTVPFLLAACLGGPTASNDVQKSAERKSGFLNLQTKEAVVATTPKAFAGVNQVIVGGFTVGFATYKTDSAKAGGGLMGNGMGGKSTAKSTLTGIDTQVMQKITDRAYANFISDLKAKGYTVLDRKQLANYPDFKSTKAYDNPYESSAGGLFGTSSKTVHFAPSSFGELKPFMGDIGGMSAFGFSNPTIAATKFAKETGIKVLNVVYVVDFANADSYGGSWTSSSSVKVGQGVTVIPEYSKMNITGGDGGTFSTNNGTINLGQPITSMHEFATVADQTSGASRGMEIAANVIGVIGGVGTNAKRDYIFEARPGDYSTAANDALSKANNTLTGKMASLK